MRFFGLIAAIFVAFVYAQTQPNYINIPEGGFNVIAGQPFTISWSNPTSTTVTIRLTQGNSIAPGTGDLLIANVAASAKTATFTIPTAVNNGLYNFEIIDDSNTSTINFSSSFLISGATLVQTSAASFTSTVTSTGSSSASSSASSGSSTSSHTSSSSASSGSSTSSHASSSSASRTSTSSTSSAAATTSISSTNGAAYAQVGGFLAIMAGAVAVF